MQVFNVTPEQIHELVHRAQGGERAAFDELAEGHRQRLIAWTRNRIGSHSRARLDVEDIVQDTYLRAFESIQRFVWRHEDSFFQWLSTIAQHLVWNMSRRLSAGDVNLTIDPPGSTVSPSRVMRREERFDRLERALLDLRPEEREIVRLARIEGLKAQEIAKRLGRPEPTVRSLLVRALSKLRESIGDTRSLNLPNRELDIGGSVDD